MTDFRRAENVLDEEGSEDEAKTLLARNPLVSARAPEGALRPNPEKAASASSERISDLLSQARDSIVTVEDSELQVIARISAEHTHAAELGLARESAEPLRDSEVDRLAAEVELVEVPAVPAKAAVSKSRYEVTERITVMPRTHPMANSIAPTAAPKSVPPVSARRGPFWQIVIAAAALVGLGVGLGQLQSRQASRENAVETGVAVRNTAASVEREREPAPEPQLAKAVEQPREPAVVPGSLPVAKAEQSTAAVEHLAAAERAPVAVAAAPKSVASGATPARDSVAVPVKQSEKRAAKAGVPTHPSREQVVATMKAAMPAFTSCAAGRRGVVSAQLTVRGTGQVSYALVQGSFAGTREGSCLAKALREVRFPEFSDSSLKLTYPLQF